MSEEQNTEEQTNEGPVSEHTDPAETTDTNAGDDAVQGTVAEQEPTDPGDQKPMNETD